MNLPPLYKYLDPIGAELTLKNGSFRHAQPSDFQDDMDMTVESVFPESIEAAAQQMLTGFNRTILKNLDIEPTCQNESMRAKIALLQQLFRQTPSVVGLLEHEMKDDKVAEIYDLERLTAVAAGLISELNVFLQGYRVLCVTDNHTSVRMWESYAANHTGVVVRISPNYAKDSKFKLFQPVDYVQSRPTLYEDAQSFQEDGLFGDQFEKVERILEKIIYSKTLEFEFEREYRLVVPLMPGEDRNTYPYHPEEASELYVGASMDASNKAEIVGIAKGRNPEILIF